MLFSRKWPLLFCLLSCLWLLPVAVPVLQAQEESSAVPGETPNAGESQQSLTLVRATMCERVENLIPVRSATVFSASVGQVCAFTAFDPVPQPTLIYHRWYHRDELSTQTRLRLYPPKWATYSVIQLRETDKGPWRVEVTDQNGQVFKVFRFSITD